MSCENGNHSLGDNQGEPSQSKGDEGKSPQGQVKPSQGQEKLSHKYSKKEIKDKTKERKFLFEEMIYEKDNGRYEKQLEIRSVLYSSIIKEYSLNLQKDLKSKRVLKIIFFSAIVAILIAITAMFIGALFKSFSLIKTTQNKDNEFVLSLLLQAASTIAAVLASILVLPKIIANYLFDPKEENATISIIEKIQNYDSTMYPMMNSASVNVFEFESKKEGSYNEDPNELEDLAEAGATQEDLPDNSQNKDASSGNNAPVDDAPLDGGTSSGNNTQENEAPKKDNSQNKDASSGNNAPVDDTPLDSGNSSGNNTQESDVPQKDNTSQEDDAPCDDGDSRE